MHLGKNRLLHLRNQMQIKANTIHLTKEESKRFSEALLNPAKANLALMQLIQGTKSLIETNPYLKDPAMRKKLIARSVRSSCGVEGIEKPTKAMTALAKKILKEAKKDQYRDCAKCGQPTAIPNWCCIACNL